MARLHLVVRGRALLRIGDDWTELSAGDAALLARGDCHAFADRPDRPLQPLGEIPAEPIGERAWRMREGGSGAQTLMTCCAVTFRSRASSPCSG